jgi:hypothetical protein
VWDLWLPIWHWDTFFSQYFRIAFSKSFHQSLVDIHSSPTLYNLSNSRRRWGNNAIKDGGRYDCDYGVGEDKRKKI